MSTIESELGNCDINSIRRVLDNYVNGKDLNSSFIRTHRSIQGANSESQ